MSIVKEIITIGRRLGYEFMGELRIEIECDPSMATPIKLGYAVRVALKDGANLYGANLTRANLYGANLYGANLTRANLTRANLYGAKIKDRDGREFALSRVPLQIAGLRWSVMIYDAHMQIGCQFHSLHDWNGFDDRTILGMDSRNGLTFWKAHKDLLLGVAQANGRTLDAAVQLVAQA